MREFAVGAAILGNLSAAYLLVYAGLQIPAGLFFDRFGLRGVVGSACAITALGCLAFAISETVLFAYIARVMIGMGAAFSFVGALNMAARWYPRRFALLGGWAQMLGSAGGLVGQAPLGLVIGVYGWRSTNLVLGAVGLILAILLCITVRDPDKSISTGSPSVWIGLQTVAKNKQTWFATIAAAGLTGTLLAFGGLWGVPYLMMARDINKPEAASLVSIIFLGWAISAPLLGWFSDRIGKRRPLIIIGTAAATFTTAILIIWPTLHLFPLIFILVVQGASSASMILCFAVARESNSSETSGAVLGLVNTFVVGSGAILQPLVGLGLDSFWNGGFVNGVRVYQVNDYRLSLMLLPIVCVISLSAAFLVNEPKQIGKT